MSTLETPWRFGSLHDFFWDIPMVPLRCICPAAESLLQPAQLTNLLHSPPQLFVLESETSLCTISAGTCFSGDWFKESCQLSSNSSSTSTRVCTCCETSLGHIATGAPEPLANSKQGVIHDFVYKRLPNKQPMSALLIGKTSSACVYAWPPQYDWT